MCLQTCFGYVCIYVLIYICRNASIYLFRQTYMNGCLYICMYVYVCTYICLHNFIMLVQENYISIMDCNYDSIT